MIGRPELTIGGAVPPKGPRKSPGKIPVTRDRKVPTSCLRWMKTGGCGHHSKEQARMNTRYIIALSLLTAACGGGSTGPSDPAFPCTTAGATTSSVCQPQSWTASAPSPGPTPSVNSGGTSIRCLACPTSCRGTRARTPASGRSRSTDTVPGWLAPERYPDLGSFQGQGSSPWPALLATSRTAAITLLW